MKAKNTNVSFLHFYLQWGTGFLLPFGLLIFFFPPPCSPASLNGLSRDSRQLLSFKDRIFNQKPFQNWVSSISPCSFTGVTCKGSRVSSVDLTNAMLDVDFGLVSSYLLGLENLESLVLKNTSLSGNNIPELMSFKFLSYLDLSANNFSGNFPSFRDCSSLQHLDLSSKKFSGNIGASLSSCSSLGFLDLSNNKFSGELPVETLLKMTSLRTLVLSFNSFVGGLSESFSSLVNLETLDLSSNNFSGLIPSGMCKDPKNTLKVLYLQNNLFTGPIPERLSNCSQLESLDLSFNYLNGKIPSSLGSLSKLKDLMICNCTNLKWISLSNNFLSGAIPASFGRLSSLAILKLGNNSISGNIPAELGNCSSLLWLDLNTNFLNGPIPPDLFKQSGNIALPLLSVKHFLYIWNDTSEQCHTTGNLLEFEGITEDRLDRISARQPCRFTVYKDIISQPSFSHNGSMVFLDLSYNKLEGNIPKELGSLYYLLVLNLGHNHLSGLIPQELGGLKNARLLYLSHNRLNGSIPQTLTSLTLLGYIDLSNNLLVGTIPHSDLFDTYSREFFANNSGLFDYIHPEYGLESNSSSNSSYKPGGSEKNYYIIIPTCAGIAVVIGLVILLLVLRRGGERREESDGEEWSMISFQSTRKVNVKSDVYSFGVVLLELTTGREAVTANEDMNLAQWAHKHQKEGNPVADAFDEEIKDPQHLKAATTVFKLGLACTLSSPLNRPCMKDILKILQRCQREEPFVFKEVIDSCSLFNVSIVPIDQFGDKN
nr:systemin receptor SR160-like [Ipomoea batatas]